MRELGEGEVGPFCLPVGGELWDSGGDEKSSVGSETGKNSLLEGKALAATSCAEILHCDVGGWDAPMWYVMVWKKSKKRRWGRIFW